MRADTIIIGSGISGLMSGCRLLESGRSVAIFEKGEPAKEASWAGGGILSPLQPWAYPEAVVRLAAWSQAEYERICRDLLETTGVDPEYQKNGMLVLQPEESPADEWVIANGVGHCMRPMDYAAVVPGILSDQPKGFWFKDVAQARNPRLLQSLLCRFSQLGGELVSGTPISEVVIANGRVAGVRTSAGVQGAAEVVVCAGAWSGALLEKQEAPLEIKPIRGQMVLLRGEPGLFDPVIVRGSAYLIPRRDGRILVGSTTEDVGFDKSTDFDTLAMLHCAADAILPGLGSLPVERHWAGLRPSPPAGIPYIGPVGEAAGLWVNTGHYRNGLVMAPGAAALLVAQMTGERPPVDPVPYQPSVISVY